MDVRSCARYKLRQLQSRARGRSALCSPVRVTVAFPTAHEYLDLNYNRIIYLGTSVVKRSRLLTSLSHAMRRDPPRARLVCLCTYGAEGGGIRFLVACSNAYANSMSRGSLHAIPEKLIPYGIGLALKPSGRGGVSTFGTMPNGTITVG